MNSELIKSWLLVDYVEIENPNEWIRDSRTKCEQRL